MDIVISRPYRDPGDIVQMQAVVQHAWKPLAQWHIGDVAWQRWHLDGEYAWKTQI